MLISGRLASCGGTQQLQAAILPAENPLGKDFFIIIFFKSSDVLEVPKLISNIPVRVWYKRKFSSLSGKRDPELCSLWLLRTQNPPSSSVHFYLMAPCSCSSFSHKHMRGGRTRSLSLEAFSWNLTQNKWVLLSKERRMVPGSWDLSSMHQLRFKFLSNGKLKFL